MKILVVGSGGREHALCWSIAASPLCSALYCAPGNAGIAEEATCVAIGSEDIEGLVAFAKTEEIDFVVVGPEAPLVLGLVDALAAEGIKAFGPNAAAAQMEGSKGFMKDILAKYDVPSARYKRFSEVEPAKVFAQELGAPVVVKTDGLAAGKGVTVAMSLEEAFAAIDESLQDGKFGAAGEEIIVEEFIEGEEISIFALCDGAHALMLASAQDHKRAFDGDEGPNTGGMGAYSPAPLWNEALEERVMREIIQPTLAGLAAEGCAYKGVLFGGLMITPEGEPKVLEYNVRFGDPECQVLMLRLMSDLLPALLASADGQLDRITLRWYEDPALVVVMAAQGYPGSYEKGTVICGLEEAAQVEGAQIFHAGTKRSEAGDLLASGGRVLGVAASGESVRQARDRAYDAISKIDWPQGFFRRDIAWRALKD